MNEGSLGPLLAPFCKMIADLVMKQIEALLARPAPGPRLYDRNGLAEALQCSSSLVDKMRQRGMPCVRLGDSPRFDYDECYAWLKARHEGSEQ